MMLDNETCKVLCTQTVTPDNARFINSRVREDYAINWLIDGLPAAEMKEDKKTGEVFFDMGFNLGYDEGEYTEMPALHNHYDIVLRSVNLPHLLQHSADECARPDITNRARTCSASLVSLCGQSGKPSERDVTGSSPSDRALPTQAGAAHKRYLRTDMSIAALLRRPP